MDKLFYCYSLPLKNYLIRNGLRFLHFGTHKTTHKNFYVFVGDEKLNKLLEQWRNRKH